jgi:hypothetical protein
LYYSSRSAFGRWDGKRTQLLADVSSEPLLEFTDLWGNTSDEVFLGVRDQTQPAHRS